MDIVGLPHFLPPLSRLCVYEVFIVLFVEELFTKIAADFVEAMSRQTVKKG